MKKKSYISTKFIILIPVFILGFVSVVSNILAVTNIKRVNANATQIANGYMSCISELGDIQKETLLIHRLGLSHIVATDLNTMISLVETIRSEQETLETYLDDFQEYVTDDNKAEYDALVSNYEALLYESGMIRRAGRVDNKDAFLDTFALEKERGITIFSKQAVLKLPEETVTLLDTPGHVDFSAEMERTLQVLDYAILVISGADGVQAHTRTLFGLLAKYEVPVFLFVNKMDQPGTDQEALLLELKKELHENCVDFSDQESAAFAENVAVCDEQVLEQYLAGEAVGTEQIRKLIRERKLFPCYFGSALKMQGVKAFLADFIRYASIPACGETFGARVFKIARDAQGNRLTYLKVTGGSLKVRQVIGEEKINQIRIYSGEK